MSIKIDKNNIIYQKFDYKWEIIEGNKNCLLADGCNNQCFIDALPMKKITEYIIEIWTYDKEKKLFKKIIKTFQENFYSHESYCLEQIKKNKVDDFVKGVNGNRYVDVETKEEKITDNEELNRIICSRYLEDVDLDKAKKEIKIIKKSKEKNKLIDRLIKLEKRIYKKEDFFKESSAMLDEYSNEEAKKMVAKLLIGTNLSINKESIKESEDLLNKYFPKFSLTRLSLKIDIIIYKFLLFLKNFLWCAEQKQD